MPCNFAKFSLFLKFYLLAKLREEFKWEPFTQNFLIYEKFRLALVYLYLLSLCEHSFFTNHTDADLYYVVNSMCVAVKYTTPLWKTKTKQINPQ